jgi:DNA-directed RNA polymerase specialized sigma24 family protein
MEDQVRYIQDARGRIGRVLDDKRAEYAYGVGLWPRGEVTVLEEGEGAKQLEAQRVLMWERVQQLEALAKRVAWEACSKLDASPSERVQVADQLVADVALRWTGYAAVTWRPTEAKLSVYVRRVLTHEYGKWLARRVRGREYSAEEQLLKVPDTKISAELDLLAKDELKSLGLSTEELELLLLRYDSDLSLEQIRKLLGVESRYTVTYRLQRVIDRCRTSRETK